MKLTRLCSHAPVAAFLPTRVGQDGSTPPDVPPCFVWRDEATNTSVIALFNWPGYGSLPLSHQMHCEVVSFGHSGITLIARGMKLTSLCSHAPVAVLLLACVGQDGFDHALVYNWNGDNAGPFDAHEYGEHWKEIRASFPNALGIYASTLDNFTRALKTVQGKLPVVSSEIADSWVYGVPR